MGEERLKLFLLGHLRAERGGRRLEKSTPVTMAPAPARRALPSPGPEPRSSTRWPDSTAAAATRNGTACDVKR